MKDEEIKLPELPNQGFGETRSRGVSTKFYDEHTVRNLMREAVRLNQPKPEPLPFNLEAAKRGDVVVYGNYYLRWIGTSQHNKGMNVLEGANGLTYAADCDLFMKPKPMRTVYINVDTHDNFYVYPDKESATEEGREFNSKTIAYPVIVPA